MSVNKAILVGRLGRDPETRYTSGGQAVCNFTLATDETYKDRNGERQKRTEWHRIVVWGKQAEIAQQYLHKGSLIFVEGRIQTRQWDDREGQKRTTVEIVASNFRMLGGRSEGGAMAAGATGIAGVVQLSLERRNVFCVSFEVPRLPIEVAGAAQVLDAGAQMKERAERYSDFMFESGDVGAGAAALRQRAFVIGDRIGHRADRKRPIARELRVGGGALRVAGSPPMMG